MCNMVVIDNLNFKYSNRVVFKNLSLSISSGSFTTILGNNGSGKSTLVKLLVGLEDSNSSILIDGNLVNSFNHEIGAVFEKSIFITSTVFDELAFSLKNLGLTNDLINSRINDISSLLGIDVTREISSLSYGEKRLVSFGCALVTKPKLLILDEAFSQLDEMMSANMLSFLKRINEDYGVTIINFTHDIEESVYGDDILILDDGKVLIHDSKDNVYKQEKLLKDLSFDLPFMVSLSNKLSYYDLVSDVIFDMNEMVDLLWK